MSPNPVVADMSMSLDGCIAGPNVGPVNPMGDGGERLHDWLFTPGDDRDRALAEENTASTGAVVLGRRTFDLGLDHWGDTPFPVPCFVVTHEPREPLPQPSGTFAFVTEGVARAVELAAAAGQKKVRLMGADVTRQALAADLVDEITIQLVPILLGDGARPFGHLDGGPAEFERVRVVATPAVTHLLFRRRR